MKVKLSKKQRQFIINSFIICSFISFAVIIFGRLTLPNKSSQDIATTIGGILGTAFSFFGSILVYLALKAQIEANEQVRKQFERQEKDSIINYQIEYFNKLIFVLRDDINQFYYSYRKGKDTGGEQKLNYLGSQAIYFLLKNVSTNNHCSHNEVYSNFPKLGELKAILVFYKEIIEKLEDDILLQNSKKKYIYEILVYLYFSKIKYTFKSLEKNKALSNENCKSCGQFHGIPQELFILIDEIDNKLKIYSDV